MVNIQLFAKDFKGTLCTETMLVRGINDHLAGLQRLAKIVAALSPHKAYLSVPIRPPAESYIKVPKEENLNTAWQIYSEQQIETELLTGWEGARTGYTGNAYEDILSITAVHPLREEAMDELLQHDKADKVVLEELLSKQLVRATEYNGKKYYLRKFIV